MDSTRWEHIQSLFHHVADLPTREGYSFLTRECRNDPSLVAEVLNLIEEDSKTGLLDRGPANAAREIFSTPSGPIPTQAQFGPYRILSLLGEGGMGVVYLARREDLGNPVAIKFLRDAFLSPARRERFDNEQRMLAQLNHPSIARLYDAGTLSDGSPWFVMEYVEGSSLTAYCRARACSIRERLELFRSVCEAVGYAHGQALIHRDLKPSNILVKADGVVKLLDFGIAKQITGPGAMVDRTRTHWMPMTPAYAAPEQIRGDSATVVTDVYSLGVVLYELLTGRLPYDVTDQTLGAMERMILEAEPAKPSVIATDWGQLSKSARADLDVLCLTALHKDTERRYRSTEALIRDIDHFLKLEPLEASPDSIGYRFGKFLQRNRTPVIAAVAAVTVLLSLIVFYTVKLRTARDAATAQASRAQRIQQFTLNLFKGGHGDTVAPSEDLRVLTLLDRGVTEARYLNREPLVQADLYQTLANIYEDLGHFEQADQLFRLTLALSKSHLGDNDPRVAGALVALGRSKVKQGNFSEAEQLVRKGLSIDESHGSSDSATFANDWSALGLVLDGKGDHRKAAEMFEKALSAQSTSNAQTPEAAATVASLADTQFYLGDLERSESLNRQALAIYKRAYGENYPLLAGIYVNLGACEFQRGRYVEAERFNRQALQVNERWYGRNHPETAQSLTYLGQALESQNRFAEAETALKEALAINEHVYGAAHFRVAIALHQLGSLAYSTGHDEQAESFLNRAIQIYKVYDKNPERLSKSESVLGNVYLHRKDYSRAEAIFREALRLDSQTLPSGHLDIGVNQVKLGRALLRQNRFTEAETQTRSGYEILKATSAPSAFLRTACKDLDAEYQALEQPLKAERYRSELAHLQP